MVYTIKRKSKAQENLLIYSGDFSLFHLSSAARRRDLSVQIEDQGDVHRGVTVTNLREVKGLQEFTL